ncbi:MAG TPA: translation initiation factor IF-2 N-terminal domain-containing protein, partial [Vicinamibacterales bacterium]|nr:translation initiation factor IF-2 N-terminal domain-containing protein [Vicinamibacterales bacterium]
MATVRIYKVAELLGTTSQEVLSLLKREHGIELKSASSTIEEVVARSFVERVARQKNISLPGGDMFAEHPVPAKGGKKAPVAKKPEPPKPTAPVLGPPRLVKVVRPAAATAPAEEPAVAQLHDAAVEEPTPEPPVAPPPPIHEPVAQTPPPVEEPPPVTPPVPVDEPAPEPE